jgi:hypothetical protein
MTDSRCKRYGKSIISVCQKFAEKRFSYLEDKKAAEMVALQDEQFIDNGDGHSFDDGEANDGWIGKSRL